MLHFSNAAPSSPGWRRPSRTSTTSVNPSHCSSNAELQQRRDAEAAQAKEARAALRQLQRDARRETGTPQASAGIDASCALRGPPISRPGHSRAALDAFGSAHAAAEEAPPAGDGGSDSDGESGWTDDGESLASGLSLSLS